MTVHVAPASTVPSPAVVVTTPGHWVRPDGSIDLIARAWAVRGTV